MQLPLFIDPQVRLPGWEDITALDGLLNRSPIAQRIHDLAERTDLYIVSGAIVIDGV
jgi:hypothetical protein